MLSARGAKDAEIRTALLRLKFNEQQAVEEIAGIMGVDFASYLSTVKPYITSDQVTKMITMGFAFGGHSVDHPLYSALPIDEQLHQTCESVKYVRERFSLEYSAFAFPHGHNSVSQQCLREIITKCEVDVCFGTGGIQRGATANHFHRFSMENSLAPTQRILSYFYGRSLCKSITSRFGRASGIRQYGEGAPSVEVSLGDLGSPSPSGEK